MTWAQSAPAPVDADGLVTIVANVTELRSDRGEVSAGLYASRQGWPDHGTSIENCRARPRGRRATCTFRAAPGVYAIGLMHDEDGDRVFDRNFLGLPEEGYGFSNNPGTGLSGPSWESSTFRATEGATLTIRMRYGI